MVTARRAMVLCLSLGLASAQAFADEPAPEVSTTKSPPHAGDVQHRLSVTVDPLLLLPIQTSTGIATTVLEVTGEYRIADKLSAAAILGGGVVSSASAQIPVFEIGGQFLTYPLGYFEHGLQLGVEVIDLPVAATINGVAATGNGIAFGGLVGYKLATNLGFSLNIQGGVGYEAVVATAQANGVSATASGGGVIPLLRINLGWSF